MHRDTHGLSPVHLAFRLGRDEFLEVFLKCAESRHFTTFIKKSPPFKWSVLDEAITYGNRLVRLLGYNFYPQNCQLFQLALYIAIKKQVKYSSDTRYVRAKLFLSQLSSGISVFSYVEDLTRVLINFNEVHAFRRVIWGFLWKFSLKIVKWPDWDTGQIWLNRRRPPLLRPRTKLHGRISSTLKPWHRSTLASAVWSENRVLVWDHKLGWSCRSPWSTEHWEKRPFI